MGSTAELSPTFTDICLKLSMNDWALELTTALFTMPDFLVENIGQSSTEFAVLTFKLAIGFPLNMTDC